MRNLILLVSAVVLFLSVAASTNAFRCGEGGKNIASKGMHKYQVLKDCGPPVSKEIVGVDKKGNSYRIVEEWLYIIDDYGHKQMYLLKFDDEGILVETDWLGEQK